MKNITLAAVALALVTVVNAAAQGPERPVWLQRLERWMQAIEKHQPGSGDEEARAVATWTPREMRTLREDLVGLRDLVARGREGLTTSLEPQAVTYRDQPMLLPEVQRLLRLSEDEARRGDINRILWAGAMLHTDVGIFVPSDDRPVVGVAMMVRVRDGQTDGYEYPATAQWEHARALLDAIRPDPGHDETVLLWYKATTAYLLATAALSDATAQLERGRQLFPVDADLLFFSGCAREAYSAPALQDAARLVVLPPGHSLNLGSRRSHLQAAEGDFTRVLERNPRLTEARVRLGHVLGLLGRHQEAADHLRAAATTIGDSQVLYWACMFLGEEEQALGRPDAARASYERAASIYPRAQSPLFALSDLASRSGDTAGAIRAVGRIRQLPADENERTDPWIGYYAAGGRETQSLLSNLMAAVPRGPKQ